MASCMLKGQFSVFKGEISVLEAGHGQCIRALRAQRFYNTHVLNSAKLPVAFCYQGRAFLAPAVQRGDGGMQRNTCGCLRGSRICSPRGPQTFAIGLCWILHQVSSHQFMQSRELLCHGAGAARPAAMLGDGE